MRDPCLNEDQSWGTSLSAPTLNGIAADVIASAPSKMTAWPEKVRAVLMATAENVDGGEWNSAIDGRDGAGVVNGETAVAFAQGLVEVSPSSTAVTDGIGTGSISNANWASTLNYNVKIPSSKPSGKHLRVVLTWDSNPVTSGPTTGNYLSDLDLQWFGPVYHSSTSYNGNVEIVDVPSSEVVAGSTYTANINAGMNGERGRRAWPGKDKPAGSPARALRKQGP